MSEASHNYASQTVQISGSCNEATYVGTISLPPGRWDVSQSWNDNVLIVIARRSPTLPEREET